VSLALEEMRKLRHFARRRLANPHGQQLCHYLDGVPWERALDDRLLVPWEMSLGYHTPRWATFREEERLALNHWTYAMMYFRISDGERFAVVANRAIAEALAPDEPELASLMRLESDEEVDHIAAFGRVWAALQRRHGFGAVRMPVKPLRPLLVSERSVRFLVRAFGADFVATYYLGRGLVNHMGKAFETRVADLSEGAPALTKLSMLHTVDENRHMAVSRMMAACTYALLERRSQRGALYEALHQAMQQVTIRYTFSDRITTAQERAMSHRVLPLMATLRRIPRDTLAATIDAHFEGVTGIEHAKNAFMPRFNQRLLDRACLTPEDKQTWFSLLVSLQRNLRFFPEGYTPAAAEGAPAFEDELD